MGTCARSGFGGRSFRSDVERTELSNLADFVWRIADHLRGFYKPHQYGGIILPFTILRRLDCVLAPTKPQVMELAGRYPKNSDRLDYEVQKLTGLTFYNVSKLDFAALVADPDNVAANLRAYIAGFSQVVDVFSRFNLDDKIEALDDAGRLYPVVKDFSERDFSTRAMSDSKMGDLFEELIRRFSEAENESAGEHFTPRDAIKLMVDILTAEDEEAFQTTSVPVRSIYDPTAGTGGMLSLTETRLTDLNGNARISLYGQELNPESYAICRSNFLMRGQDAHNIRQGDTLARDAFAGRTFDYCLSNPPYGYSWKDSEHAVKQERKLAGANGRFAAGLPAISDGQLLFLSHLAHKMRPAEADGSGGGRAGIVLNGSALFAGRPGGGESGIRRWLFESDLVDAVIALPTDEFYNTGIATYIWILDNTKTPERRGKVQLIDATGFATPLRKSLGAKRNQISDDDRVRIAQIYAGFEESDHCRIVDPHEFAFTEITVERPLRRSFTLDEAAVERALTAKAVAKLPEVTRETLRTVLGEDPSKTWLSQNEFNTHLHHRLNLDHELHLKEPVFKALIKAIGAPDDNAEISLDAKGKPIADTSLRDTERVPWGTDINDYFATEVKPYAPGAWLDRTKDKIGYEIPFKRYFYTYTPPRSLAEIDADIAETISQIEELFAEVKR